MAKSRTYRAREFARLTGVTVKALHHYERLGLLKPHRNDAGYRLYSEQHLERVEQIVALRFLGIPLKQIGKVLDRHQVPLPEALRLQREALEQKRREIDQAIRAIRSAESLVGSPSESKVLQTLVEIIAMHTDVDGMKRYFTAAMWPRAKRLYETWPSEEWRRLLREAESVTPSSARDERSQELADRWLALVEADAAGDRVLRDCYIRAWFDRDNWPAALRSTVARFPLKSMADVLVEAAWKRWEAEVKKRDAPALRAPDRVSETRLQLFRDAEAALPEGPASGAGQRLAERWRAIVDEEAGADEELRSMLMRAWSTRNQWPPVMHRYVASLYAMDIDTWDRVADFLEAAHKF